MIKISAILLAAGSSSRMGRRNKLLLPFQGKTILQHCYDQLPKASLNEIVVVTGHEKEEINKHFKAGNKTTFAHNALFHTGMTGSIKTGISNLSAGWDAVVICLGDMPLLTTDDHLHIIHTFHKLHTDQPMILVPKYDESSGNPVVFSHHFKKDILVHPAPEGCKGIIQAHPSAVQFINMPNPLAGGDVDNSRVYDKLLSNYKA